MTENEYTPGPWSACDGGKCRCKYVWCEDYPVAKVISGEWGDPGFPYGSVDEAVAIANARLIAAAPDLLEACKALLEIVEFDYALHIDNAYWPTVRPVYEQAKAAVARGEHDVPTDA